MLRLIPVALLFACLLPRPAPAVSQVDGPRTVSAISHGVRVSLTVSHEQYPIDALTVFIVRVQNVGTTNRYLQDFQPDYGGPYSPHILMRKPSGALLYEEQLSQFLAPSPGSLASNYLLHPGESLTRHVRFVLRAADVQAVSLVVDGYTALHEPPGHPNPPRSELAKHLWRPASPWLHLTLTSEPAPTVRVTRTGTHVHVVARPASPMSGPAFYMDSARCWFRGSVMSTDQHVPWTRAAGAAFTSTVTPHCPSAQPYRAVIGWPDHRVAWVDYRSVSGIPRGR